MQRCAECHRAVRKHPVRIGRNVWGPTCARRLGLTRRRQMAVKSLTSKNTPAGGRAANTRQMTYAYGEPMNGQLELFTVEEEVGIR